MSETPTIFTVSERWKAAYPAARAGVLAMEGVENPPSSIELDRRKQELEDRLRSQYAGQDRKALEALPVLQAYKAYYKRFNKSYHVQGQLESIAFKGRDIPRVAALVEAMFMAEVKNLLLTAGHDLDLVRLPAVLDVASGEESYTLLRGDPQATKAGDMFIADRDGILSSIVYGPDRRTQINPITHRVLFTVYAPEGINAQLVQDHLDDIRDNVLVVSPAAKVLLSQVFDGSGS